MFIQSAESHLSGRGCPSCLATGFNTQKIGYLYILKTPCGVTKVGITNKVVTERVKQINTSTDLGFVLDLFIRFENGLHALNIETAVLKSLRYSHKRLSVKFDGSTECFYDVDQAYLLNLISNTYSKILNKEA